MANQVSTTFTINAGQALRQLSEYQRQLKTVIQLQQQLGAGPAVRGGGGGGRGRSANVQMDDQVRVFRAMEKQAAAATRIQEREAKRAEQIRQRELRAAERDAQRYARAREKMEREITRQLEREARTRERIRQREGRRQTNEFIGSLTPGTPGGAGGSGSFWIDVAGDMGIPQRAIASYVAAGAAIAAVTVAGEQLINFYVRSTERAIGVERANRLLASSAKELGQTYGALAEENRKFADLVGISNVEAARATAQIARLATNAGLTQVEDVQKLTRAFADLGAARGIAGKDLEILMGTILSGQDEGLNRLGIADPGQLQREYAKSIGTTSDKLTQQQKVLAAVLAVLKKAENFTGAAEERMKGLEGSVANATKAWEDFVNAVSTSVANNQTLRLLLGIGTTGLKLLTPGATVQERISSGAEPTALDRIGASLPGLGEATLSGIALKAAPGPLKIGVGVGLALRRIFEGQKAISDAQMARMGEENMKIFNANKKREEEALQAYKDRVSQEIAEEDSKFKQMSAMEDNYYRLREAQATQYLAKNKQEELAQAKAVSNIRIEAAEVAFNRQRAFLNEQIDSLQKLADLGDQEAEERRQKLIEQRDFELPKQELEIELLKIEAAKEQQRIERELAEQRKANLREIRGIISESFGRTNPFVKVFEDASAAIMRAKELTKEFGQDIKNMTMQAVQMANFQNLTEARMSNRIQSVNLDIEASRLRRGIDPSQLNEYEMRRLRQQELQQQINAISDMNRGGGQFQWYETRPTAEAVRSAIPGATEADIKRNQAEYDARLQQAISQFEKQAQYSEAQQRAFDQQIIALTQGMTAQELTREQRDLAIGAREREADRLRKQEGEALKLFQALNAQLTGTGVKVQIAGGSEQIVRIVDESGGRARVESRPSQNSTNNYYGG